MLQAFGVELEFVVFMVQLLVLLDERMIILDFTALFMTLLRLFGYAMTL